MKNDSPLLFRLRRYLYFLTILFIPTQFGRHFWPSWSYVSGIRVDYLSPTMYVTDLLITFLFLMWIASEFLALKSKSQIHTNIPKTKRGKAVHSKNWNLFGVWRLELGIFFIILLMGIFFSKTPLLGLYALVKLTEFIFLGWCTSQLVKTKKDLLSLTILFSCGLVFESLLAILQFIHQGSLGGILYFLGERTFFPSTPGIAVASIEGRLILRPYATFSHPNVLAGYLVVCLLLVLGSLRLLSKEITHVKKYFFCMSLVIGTLALLLTLSRLAILVWFFLICWYFFKALFGKTYLGRSSLLKKIALGCLFVMALCTILFPLQGRFGMLSLTDESVTVRERLLQAAMGMVEKHPLFGVGLNNFLPNLLQFQHLQKESLFSFLQPVHNIFFLVLAETGIVGFLLFSWVVVQTVLHAKKQKIIFSYVTPILFSFFVLGMFDHYLLTLQQGQLLLAFIFGLCWSRKINTV